MYLIICDACGVEKWYTRSQCRGKNKFCNRHCVNLGRKHSDEWKSKMSFANVGVRNPFYGRKHDEETRARISAGASIGLKNMSIEKAAEASRKRSEAASGANNAFYGKTHDKETRKRMSRSRAEGIMMGRIVTPRGIKGWYTSTKTGEKYYHDSFYEAIRMKILDETLEVKSWTKRHGIMIEYEFDNNNKLYVPDFLIEYQDGTCTLEEVKGYENPLKLSAKIKALEQYCQTHGFQGRVIMQKELEQITLNLYNKKISQLRFEFLKEQK